MSNSTSESKAGSTAQARPPAVVRPLKPHPSRKDVSDSEEERQRRIRLRRAALANVSQNEMRIIVVSSDEEDASSASVIAQKGSQPSQAEIVPRKSTPKRHEQAQRERASSDDSREEWPPVTPRRRQGAASRMRNVVFSSSSGSESESNEADEAPAQEESFIVPTPRRKRLPVDESDVIDLTLSSSEDDEQFQRIHPSRDGNAARIGEKTPPTKQRSRATSEKADNYVPLFLSDSESEREHGRTEAEANDPFLADDGAILTLDEPRSTQKPVRRRKTTPAFNSPAPSAPLRGPTKTLLSHSLTFPLDSDTDSGSEDEVAAIIKPAARPTPTALSVVAGARSSSASPGPSKLAGKGKGKAPRLTKKAQQQLELERRRAYAQAFFAELNAAVFKGGIPAETALEWNKRLLTTAGRAHWKRTSEGVNITSIQLAEKILDSDERIRNTLSHEMCHLACWIINDAPDENHGALFKSWAQKVMRKRPEVEVTTRHSYEIKCKYEWKCAKCAKVYGRHSKSINPEEHVCGVCKTGQLVPQFESRRAPPRTPRSKAAADSQNAAARSRDSPLHMPGAFPSPVVGSPLKWCAATRARATRGACSDDEIGGEDDDADGDSDVEFLARGLKTVHISAYGV
ncbi:SprT-like family-domain-containing protein [Daedaleopsis nitida]|nr:SprT-like family-domain-containing protein [Daedaleopsis nitida]